MATPEKKGEKIERDKFLKFEAYVVSAVGPVPHSDEEQERQEPLHRLDQDLVGAKQFSTVNEETEDCSNCLDEWCEEFL